MNFSFTVSMYQGTKTAFKNALLLSFLQSEETSNLRALLTRSGNAFFSNIFTFCVVVVILNMHVKDHCN